MIKAHPKVVSYKRAARIARALKKEGKKIVLHTGCFDIFHIGHARALQYCKNLGDTLFVAIASDQRVRKLKGKERPIFPEEYRAELLAALECVDYVVIIKESYRGLIDHRKLLSLIRPHYYTMPPDDKVLNEKLKLMKKLGIAVKLKDETKSTGLPISSSEIYKKLKEY